MRLRKNFGATQNVNFEISFLLVCELAERRVFWIFISQPATKVNADVRDANIYDNRVKVPVAPPQTLSNLHKSNSFPINLHDCHAHNVSLSATCLLHADSPALPPASSLH